jgi:hypothetical protein
VPWRSRGVPPVRRAGQAPAPRPGASLAASSAR